MLSHLSMRWCEYPDLKAHISQCSHMGTSQGTTPEWSPCAAVPVVSLLISVPCPWVATEEMCRRQSRALPRGGLLYQQSQEAAQIPGKDPPSAFWEADSTFQPVLLLKRQAGLGEKLKAWSTSASYLPIYIYGHITYIYTYMYVPIQGKMQSVQHCGLCSSL